MADDDFSTDDLWLAFVNWMAHFFPDKVMKQQIVEVASRRAQMLLWQLRQPSAPDVLPAANQGPRTP